MKISEIFHSIQGEGTLLGVPSVFIRTSGCNLRCTWCDTPYTSWVPEGKEMTETEILRTVEAFGCGHAVVTGGEPMMLAAVVPLTERLKELGMHVTVETAGTVFQPVVCDLMSISPKLANSTPSEREGGRWAAQHDRLRHQPEVLRRLMLDYEYQIKFVVSSLADLREIRGWIAEMNADTRRVLLMAEGISAAAIQSKAQWLTAVCKEEGWRYSPRLHIDLWGDQRGV